MNRLRASLVILLTCAAVPAQAGDFVDSVVRQLQRQGYDQIVVERTLLGRVQIHATKPNASREVVLNPHTGEILRDLRKGQTASVLDDDDDDDETDDDSNGRGRGRGGDDSEDGGDDGGGDDGGGGDD